MSIFAQIEAFIETKVWPFLKNIGKVAVQAEIQTLEPIAVALVSQVEGAIVSAATSGSLSDLGAVLGKLVTDTAVEAQGKALAAGATSILAAVGTALATNAATSTALAVPAPAPVVVSAVTEPTVEAAQ